MPTPLHVVSGFLGAGKTTAILAWLEAARGEKLAIIVNDFGEASLDEVALAEGEPFRITNIPGACVCCTAPEGFVDALGAVLDTAPDRIVIEPTGLARPQDLIDTVRRGPHRDRVAVAPVVVLVDPGALEDDGTARGVLREQLDAADLLVANKTDLASADELARFERLAESLWPPPLTVHRTTHGQIPLELLDWPEGEGARVRETGAHAHTHDHSTAGYAARSWQWSPMTVFSRERLSDAVARLARGDAGAPTARLKGIFRTLEGVFRIEISGGRVDEGLTSFRRDSRADLILEGESDSDRALDQAGQWLEAAVLTEEERELSPDRIEIILEDGRAHVIDRALLLDVPEQMPDVSLHFPKRTGTAAHIRGLWYKLGLPELGHVVVVAGDGFATEPVPVHTLLEGVLLHTLEDEPLPPTQGGPFRLLIPESANPPSGACANVKSVAKLVHRSTSPAADPGS